MRIIKLTPELANQIAAGEVVERPAAVIKELLENSLDAGATRIDIDLEQGGARLISIRDNGHGIEKDDLALALARHATSKISSLSDLEQVLSLGFRGEALASISAVARLRLTSRTATQEHAWQVHVEGQDMLPQLSPASHPIGTTVEVRDLFFNTPARRKFLRSEKTEYGHIEEMLKRFALSHFNVELRVRHNHRDVLQLLPALTQQAQEIRLAKILERNFLEHALVIESAIEGLHLTGWVGLPSFSRSQTDYQFVYLNQRHVRDRVLNHAIRQAYQDQLYEGRQPAYVLYLDIDPTLVDVNVHPTKHEVRFRESRLVHDFIFRALFDSMQQEKKLPSSEGTHAATGRVAAQEQTNAAPPHSQTTYPVQYSKMTPIREPMAYYETLTQPTLATQLNPPLHCAAPLQGREYSARFIGKAHHNHFIIETEMGIGIIDRLQASRAILLQLLTTAYEANSIQQQAWSNTQTLRVHETHAQFCEAQPECLQVLGFDVERVGLAEIMIRSIPTLLQGFEETPFLALLNALESGESSRIALKKFTELCPLQIMKSEQTDWQMLYHKIKQLPRETVRSFWQEITVAKL